MSGDRPDRMRGVAPHQDDRVVRTIWAQIGQVARRSRDRLRPPEPPRDEWFAGHYVEWRAKRVAAIEDHYDVAWFRGKTVLEVGCGFGDIGGHFAELGALVTCSDARSACVLEARARYPRLRRVIRADLDKDWSRLGRHDLLLHLGVLYHLKDPVEGVRRALLAAPNIVLESEVADSDDPDLVLVTRERGYDQAYNRTGSRPSPALIERILCEAGRPFTRIQDDRCNANMHRYDWTVSNSGTWEHGLRRMWFIGPDIHAKNETDPSSLRLP